MGQKCIIKSCTNSKNKKANGLIPNVMFHKFPSNIARRESWVINIQALANQMGHIGEKSIICSEHFDKADYVKKPYGKIVLSHTAEPTLFGIVTKSCSDLEILCSSKNSFSHIEKLSSDCYSDVDLDVSDSRKHVIVTPSKMTLPKPIPVINPNLQPINPPSQTSAPVLKPNSVPANRNLQSENTSLLQRLLKPISVESKSEPSSESLQKSGLRLVPLYRILEPNKISELQLETKLVHSGTKIRRIRYAGDMADMGIMSRAQLENCVLICRKKIASQATTIKALRRQIRDKDRKIGKIRQIK